MKLTTFANNIFMFSLNGANSGDVICRECGRTVEVDIKIYKVFMLTGSKVMLKGSWCGHSNLKSDINNIIIASLNSIENSNYF